MLAKQSAFGSKAAVWHTDSACPTSVIPSYLAASCRVRLVLHSCLAHSLTNTARPPGFALVLGTKLHVRRGSTIGTRMQVKLKLQCSALGPDVVALSKDVFNTHFAHTIHSHSQHSLTRPPRPFPVPRKHTHTHLQLKEKGNKDEMCDFECDAGSLSRCPSWSALVAVVAVTLSLLCA